MYTIEQIIEFLQNDICNFLMEPGQGNPPQRYLSTIGGNSKIAFSNIGDGDTFRLHFGQNGKYHTIDADLWENAQIWYNFLNNQLVEPNQTLPIHVTSQWNVGIQIDPINDEPLIVNPNGFHGNHLPYLGALLLFIDDNHPHHNYADLENFQEEFLALRNQIFDL